MGSVVGAIPSAIGGRHVTLSHVGKVFVINETNLGRWKMWWRYVLVDQIYVWAPGCFMGMALPALLSLEFAPYSGLTGAKLEWAQSLITADGIRHAPQFSATIAKLLWIVTVFVGLLVMLPSQMSIVDDFSRRWTDILWSGSRRIRGDAQGECRQTHLLQHSQHLCVVDRGVRLPLQYLWHPETDDAGHRQPEQSGDRVDLVPPALDQLQHVAEGVASPMVPTGRGRRMWRVLPGDGPAGVHDQTNADVERDIASSDQYADRRKPRVLTHA